MKPVKNPKGRTTEAAKITKKIDKRLELVAEKANKLEMDMQAKREKLISEGVTPKILEDDSSETGSSDMDWDCGLWKVADHAVEWKTAKPNFKVITGMRAVSAGHATEKWVWGQREALGVDDFDMSVLDKYVEENCDHPVCREHLNRVVRKKDSVIAMEKAKTKKQCDHSSYDLGLSYNPDAEVNPGWCVPGKFLFGVECAGCGSPFVQKAPPARDGGGKKKEIQRCLRRTMRCAAATTFVIGTVIRRRDAAMPIARLVGMKPF